MSEPFEISGRVYKACALDLKQQFDILMVISPLIKSTMSLLSETELDEKGKPKIDPIKAFGQISDALTKMKREDSHFVIDTCMGVVERRIDDGGQGWAKVWNKAHNICMYDDIKLMQMTKIVFHVIMENFGDFFSELR